MMPTLLAHGEVPTGLLLGLGTGALLVVVGLLALIAWMVLVTGRLMGWWR